MKCEKAIFIGRFQPPHNGHVSALKKAMCEVDELIIGIGSAEKHHTSDNPFTCEERKVMIESSLDGNYRMVPIPDINDYSRWVNHVENIAGDFGIVYTGNQVVAELFEQSGYEIHPVKEDIYISSSAIRDMMAKGEKWRRYVPDNAADFLESIGGEGRVRALYKQHINPVPAVDAIIKYDDGIVLIRRPDGRLALPGGFIEFGESAESAVSRESREETNLEFYPEELVGVYSDPKRDSRNHIISIAYAGTGKGDLFAGDDAKEALVVPIKEAIALDLSFDHNKILGDYLKMHFKSLG